MKRLEIKNATAGTMAEFERIRRLLGLERGEFLRRLLILWGMDGYGRSQCCLNVPPRKLLDTKAEQAK